MDSLFVFAVAVLLPAIGGPVLALALYCAFDYLARRSAARRQRRALPVIKATDSAFDWLDASPDASGSIGDVIPVVTSADAERMEIEVIRLGPLASVVVFGRSDHSAANGVRIWVN